jgi:N-acetylmuramoyl-L-alanine amidase
VKPQGIVIHHSVTAQNVSVHIIDEMHKARGWRGIGYHYLIHKDLAGNWIVSKGRKENERGAHCPGKNDCIGVCAAGNYQVDVVPPALYRLLRRLCVTLCNKYEWNSSKLYYHRQFRDTLCPGDNLIGWLPKLMEDIDEMLPFQD